MLTYIWKAAYGEDKTVPQGKNRVCADGFSCEGSGLSPALAPDKRKASLSNSEFCSSHCYSSKALTNPELCRTNCNLCFSIRTNENGTLIFK